MADFNTRLLLGIAWKKLSVCVITNINHFHFLISNISSTITIALRTNDVHLSSIEQPRIESEHKLAQFCCTRAKATLNSCVFLSFRAPYHSSRLLGPQKRMELYWCTSCGWWWCVGRQRNLYVISIKRCNTIDIHNYTLLVWIPHAALLYIKIWLWPGEYTESREMSNIQMLLVSSRGLYKATRFHTVQVHTILLQVTTIYCKDSTLLRHYDLFGSSVILRLPVKYIRFENTSPVKLTLRRECFIRAR